MNTKTQPNAVMFFATRTAARSYKAQNGGVVRDNGTDSPKGERWAVELYEEQLDLFTEPFPESVELVEVQQKREVLKAPARKGYRIDKRFKSATSIKGRHVNVIVAHKNLDSVRSTIELKSLL